MSRAVTVVTGAAGFVGSWLMPQLEGDGQQVVPVDRPGATPTADGRPWRSVDLAQREPVRALLREVRPTGIVHLAALAYPPDAARDPLDALGVNYCAVDHLLCAMQAYAPHARLLYVGSAEVYGARAIDAPPVDETAPLEPRTPYAATKAAAEQRAFLAAANEGLHVVRVRPFNHSGPGRPALYAESSFADQVARIERGEVEPVVLVGNLEHVRDYSDVRDVVDAYRLLLERGAAGEVYNVCSGRGRSIRSVLDHLLSLATKHPIRIEREPARYRPADPDRLALVGNPGRLRALGWQPRYAFEDTLAELLDAWRSRA